MAEPTLVLWIDSIDEKTHQAERMRLHALEANVANRAHVLIDSKMFVQRTIRPENDAKILEGLPHKGWLSPEQIVEWQLAGMLPQQYKFQVCVVVLDPLISVDILNTVQSVVQRHFAELQIQMTFTLIWYKASQAWKKGQCANYWPRFAVSDRVTDWQNVIEHMVIATIDTPVATYLAEQGKSSIEVVWCGASAILLGMEQVQMTVHENMYRKMIEILRADDLTQEEIDNSKVAALQSRIAYARDMMTGIQAQVNDNFDFAIEYFVDESAEAPIILGRPTGPQQNHKQTGFSIRKDAVLGTALFATRANWWLSHDDDFSFPQMFTELLRKESVVEVYPNATDITQVLTHNFSRLHDRVTKAVRDSSQKSVDMFFAQIITQIESQQDYGLRNIQQSLQDYITQLESGQLLTFKNKIVDSSKVSTQSYFAQLAQTVNHSLTDAMNRMMRRRRSTYSLLGSLLRMILVIPLLNGIFFVLNQAFAAFLPPQVASIIPALIPIVLLLIGGCSAVDAYRQYHFYARQVRNQFIEDVLGVAVLGIIQSAFVRERDRLLGHLRHLNSIYIDLIESYDQQHIAQVKPVDMISSNAWILQQIDTVWGESKRIVTDDVDNLGDWDLVIGEEVTTYSIDGQTRLSFQSQTQVEVNRDARTNQIYRGSALLLQKVVDQLHKRPLTKHSVETRMRDFCNIYVKRVFENPMNKLHILYEINRSATVVMPSTGSIIDRITMLGNGKHWVWLYTAANQNATPRAQTPTTTKAVSILIIPTFLQGDLENKIGRPNPNWVEPNVIIPISKAFDEEIIHVRMDIDFVK